MSDAVKYTVKMAGVLLIFLYVWFLLADSLSSSSDEDHFSQGKALYLTGKPIGLDFDTGKFLDFNNGRGFLIDRTTSFFYSIQPKSANELMWIRVVPLLFTLLSFALMAAYGFFRLRMALRGVLYLSVLFLGQSMVLEQSLFLRYYPILLFFMAAILICYWEGQQFFLKDRKVKGAILLLISAVFLVVTVKSHWQIEHLVTMALVILLSFRRNFDGFVEFLHVRRTQLVFMLIGLLIICPFLILVGEELVFSKLVIGNEPTGITFVTYWDNMMGLLRAALALNIGWTGIFMAIIHGPKKIKFGLGWVLYFAGLLTVIIFALLLPIDYIYYGRYFYLPLVLTVIGFAFEFDNLVVSIAVKRMMLVVYLLVNLFLSFIVFYFERTNMKEVIGWLKENITKEDVLLIYHPTLGLNQGEPLRAWAFAIDKSQDEIENARGLLSYVNQHPHGKIYYLFVNPHAFREKLYRWTVGENRQAINELDYYLDREIHHVNPYPHLRGGCGLDLFDRMTLIDGLKELIKKGYPKPERNISIHKRILKVIFRLCHLPDKREDIEKQFRLPHWTTDNRVFNEVDVSTLNQVQP